MKQIGERNGSPVYALENKAEAEAFIYYLAKERNRHKKDVAQIEDDLRSLSDSWDINIPDPDAGIWIDATRKPEGL